MADEFTPVLHPHAQEAFNRKAQDLVSRIVPHPSEKEATAPFKPDIFPAMHLTGEDIIGQPQISYTDRSGKEVARFFQHADKYFGLTDENFTKLMEIAEGIGKTSPFRDTVSLRCLADLAFGWLKQRFTGTTNNHFVDHVLAETKQLVQPIEIWVPVYRLFVQSELRIGRVEIKTITKEMLQVLLSTHFSKNEEVRLMFDQRIRKKLQGTAAATIRLFAEPARAEEIAFEEAETEPPALA